MLIIKEKGKPKQGRIQHGFVKGGGVVVKWRGGGVIPVHFQTKLSVEIVFSSPNEFKLSYGCSKTLQLSKDETCNTAMSRNATYYSAKFAYSQSQYTISSM